MNTKEQKGELIRVCKFVYIHLMNVQLLPCDSEPASIPVADLATDVWPL